MWKKNRDRDEQMKTGQQGMCCIRCVGESGPCPWAMGAQGKAAKSQWEIEECTELNRTKAWLQLVHRMVACGD